MLHQEGGALARDVSGVACAELFTGTADIVAGRAAGPVLPSGPCGAVRSAGTVCERRLKGQPPTTLISSASRFLTITNVLSVL